MDKKERFNKVLMHICYNHLAKNEKEIALKIGFSQATINSMKKGRFGVSDNVILALCKEFPQYNREWLLYEEGTMLKDNSVTQTANNNKDSTITQNVNNGTGEYIDINVHREQIATKDKQIDRLLTIIENMQK